MHRSSSKSSSASRSASASSRIHSATMRQPSIVAGASDSPGSNEGPSTLSVKHKEALLTFLGIPTELRKLGPPSLRTAYTKYKVLTDSIKPMQNLRSSQEWADHLDDAGVEQPWIPIFVDLINIFIAKSQFYSSWKPAFTQVQEYSEMTAWLNNESDYESDSDLWEGTKNADDYTFADLISWAKKKGAAKGKRPAVAVASSSAGQKAVGSGKDKKKKKAQKVSSEEEESSEEEKVKVKKSKGKKKASE